MPALVHARNSFLDRLLSLIIPESTAAGISQTKLPKSATASLSTLDQLLTEHLHDVLFTIWKKGTVWVKKFCQYFVNFWYPIVICVITKVRAEHERSCPAIHERRALT